MSGESIALPKRLFLVDYDLIGDNNQKTGGGTCRIEASYPDSVVKQLNAMLAGRRHKIQMVCPVN